MGDQPGRAGPVELDMTIALATLLPADTRHYYHYQVSAEIYSLQRILFVLYQDLPQPQGGLTTPTCNEAVLWTNFMATKSISEAQLAIFRSMTDSEEVAIVDNYRPPQPLNARILYTTGVRKITLKMRRGNNFRLRLVNIIYQGPTTAVAGSNTLPLIMGTVLVGAVASE